MEYVTRIVIACVFTMIGATQVHAGLLTYTGNAFTVTDAGAGSVRATFDFSTPLTNGAKLTEADITSWSMSAAGRTIDSTSFSFFDAEFNIGASLLPTSWFFGAEEQLESIALPETIGSAKGPVTSTNPPLPSTSVFDYFYVNDSLVSSLAAFSSPNSTARLNPGTFTAVPEPNSCLYLGLAALGVAVLKKATRRRKTA